MNYNEKFLQAIAITVDHEGGYSNDLDDRGGQTKYGISKRSYPELDIASLSLEDAKEIYYQDYWQPHRYHEIEDALIVIKLFDLAVNMGNRNAHKLVQRALRAAGTHIAEDGLLGEQTLAAINTASASNLLVALKSEAAGYYRCLAAIKPEQSKFLKGWLNRAYS